MEWLDYFVQNAKNRREIPWDEGVHVPVEMRADLVRSLQRFQLGESGDGCHLRRNAVGEPMEYRHALDGMKTPRLRWHWSDWGFETFRRLLGLWLEVLVLVLLVVEMIAKRYFRVLREGVDDAVVRAVAEQIGHDEEGHLAFQADYLRRAFARWPFVARVAVCAVWRVLFRAACVVVWLDHGKLLRQCGVTAEGFWYECGLIFDEVAAGVFGGAEFHTLEGLSAPNWAGK